VDDSLTIYPIVAILSVAVKLVIGMAGLIEVDGIVKEVTIGAIISV
jgi:hypothetical protein